MGREEAGEGSDAAIEIDESIVALQLQDGDDLVYDCRQLCGVDLEERGGGNLESGVFYFFDVFCRPDGTSSISAGNNGWTMVSPVLLPTRTENWVI